LAPQAFATWGLINFYILFSEGPIAAKNSGDRIPFPKFSAEYQDRTTSSISEHKYAFKNSRNNQRNQGKVISSIFASIFLVSSCFPLGRQLEPLNMGFNLKTYFLLDHGENT